MYITMPGLIQAVINFSNRRKRPASINSPESTYTNFTIIYYGKYSHLRDFIANWSTYLAFQEYSSLVDVCELHVRNHCSIPDMFLSDSTTLRHAAFLCCLSGCLFVCVYCVLFICPTVCLPTFLSVICWSSSLNARLNFFQHRVKSWKHLFQVILWLESHF